MVPDTSSGSTLHRNGTSPDPPVNLNTLEPYGPDPIVFGKSKPSNICAKCGIIYRWGAHGPFHWFYDSDAESDHEVVVKEEDKSRE